MHKNNDRDEDMKRKHSDNDEPEEPMDESLCGQSHETDGEGCLA